jgi:hypothetical protein
MTLNFHKKPQRDFVFHFFSKFLLFLTRFVCVIALVVSEHILQSKVFLSKFLQGIECDLLEATKECKTVIELLRAERLDESVWEGDWLW